MAHGGWIKFYPDDWNGDLELASCSLEAQGLMMRLIAVMHRSKPYGYLLQNGSKPLPKQISLFLGIEPKDYQRCLKELLKKGVLKQDEIGIYSARMVRDQQLREEAQRMGRRGGNPLLVNPVDKARVNPRDKARVNPWVKLDTDTEADTEAEEERARARAREEDLPPPEKFPPPAGWEPTDRSREVVAFLHSLEGLFGMWPFSPKQIGSGEADNITEELAAVLRLLSAEEALEIVKRELDARVAKTKGVDRPTNLKWYMKAIKDAFYARDRAQEEAERERNEEKKLRKRELHDEPVPIAELVERELSPEEIKERFKSVRERIAKGKEA